MAGLEDVAAHALDRKVLVDRADDLILGLEQHLIVGIVRDRTAGGQRGQPSAAPAAQLVVHRVVVNEGPPPATAGAEPIRPPHPHCRKNPPRPWPVRPATAGPPAKVVPLPPPRRALRR